MCHLYDFIAIFPYGSIILMTVKSGLMESIMHIMGLIVQQDQSLEKLYHEDEFPWLSPLLQSKTWDEYPYSYNLITLMFVIIMFIMQTWFFNMQLAESSG